MKLSLALIAGALVASAGATSATTLRKVSLERMVTYSAVICRGTVTDVRTLEADNGCVYTYAQLAVAEIYKGRQYVDLDRPLVVKHRGGIYGAHRDDVPGAPCYTIGDDVVVFLVPDFNKAEPFWFTYGMHLGVYRVETGSRGTAHALVQESDDGSFDMSAGAEADKTHRVEVNTLVDTIARTRAIDDPRVAAMQAPPSFARAASIANQATPAYALYNPPARWNQADRGEFVDFYVNQTNFPPPGSTWPSNLSTAVTNAAAAWSNVAGSSLKVRNAGATDVCGFNTVNTITSVAVDCNNEIQGSGCRSGILGLGGPRTYVRNTNGQIQTIVVNGTTFNVTESGDIVIQDDPNGDFCNEQDSQSDLDCIITHEMGHVLGLGHTQTSPDPGSPNRPTMWPVWHPFMNTLEQDDKNGIVFVYPSSAPMPHSTDSIGIVVTSTGTWFLRNANTPGPADVAFTFGAAGAGTVHLTGDWDGDGRDTPGLYNPSTGAFYLRNQNSNGPADVTFFYGAAGANLKPVVGDWDGNGTDTVGLYNPSTGVFFLKNTNAAGAADIVFSFGPAGQSLSTIVGDWDGNGTDTIGLFNASTGAFYLKNSNSGGAADVTFFYGPAGAGWVPLGGDWNADGRDTVGLYNPGAGIFYLKNANTGGAADLTFAYGPAGATALAGDWDGL